MRRFSGVGSNSRLTVVVDGVNKLGPTLNSSSAQINRFAKRTTTSNAKVGRSFAAIVPKVVSMAAAAVGAFVSISNASTRAAAQIESEWVNVTTLLPDYTKSMTDNMKEDLLNAATSLGVEWNDAIRSNYQTVSAVFTDPQEQRRMFAAADNLARAIRVPLAEATRLIIAGANAFGKTSEEFGEIADLYTTGIRFGVTTGEEMVTTLGKVLPVAQGLGLSLREVVAAHAALTNAGLDSAEAAVNQRQMYTQLLQVQQDVVVQFEKIIGQTPAQFIETGHTYVELMESIKKVQELSGHSIFDMFGRVQSANAAAILTSTQGLDIFTQAYEDSQGAAENAAKKVRQTVEYEMQQLDRLTQAAWVNLGEKLTPVTLGIKRGFADILDEIGLIDKQNLKIERSWSKFNDVIEESPDLLNPTTEGIARIEEKIIELNKATNLLGKNISQQAESVEEAALFGAFEAMEERGDADAFNLWESWLSLPEGLDDQVIDTLKEIVKEGNRAVLEPLLPEDSWGQKFWNWGKKLAKESVWVGPIPIPVGEIKELNFTSRKGAADIDNFQYREFVRHISSGGEYTSFLGSGKDYRWKSKFSSDLAHDITQITEAFIKAGRSTEDIQKFFEGLDEAAQILEKSIEKNKKSLEDWATTISASARLVSLNTTKSTDVIIQQYENQEITYEEAIEAIEKLSDSVEALITTRNVEIETAKAAVEANEKYAEAYVHAGYVLEEHSGYKFMREVQLKQRAMQILREEGELTLEWRNRLREAGVMGEETHDWFTKRVDDLDFEFGKGIYEGIDRLSLLKTRLVDIRLEYEKSDFQSQERVNLLQEQYSLEQQIKDLEKERAAQAEEALKRQEEALQLLREEAAERTRMFQQWNDILYSRGRGRFANPYDQETEHLQWKEQALKNIDRQYKIIQQRITNTVFMTAEWQRLTQELWSLEDDRQAVLDYDPNPPEPVSRAVSSFDFARAWEDAQYANRTLGRYADLDDIAAIKQRIEVLRERFEVTVYGTQEYITAIVELEQGLNELIRLENELAEAEKERLRLLEEEAAAQRQLAEQWIDLTFSRNRWIYTNAYDQEISAELRQIGRAHV